MPQKRTLAAYPVSDLQQIANARLCLDQRRLGRIAFQLVTELADDHPEMLGVPGVGGAPDCGQQVAVANDLPRASGEDGQHIVFPGRRRTGAPLRRMSRRSRSIVTSPACTDPTGVFWGAA